MEDKKEKLESSLKYFKSIPAPLPGLHKIDLVPTTDFMEYDDSLEQIVPKEIYTDIFDTLGIDLVQMVYDNLERVSLDHQQSESFLRKSEYISTDLSKRREHKSSVLGKLKSKELKENDLALHNDNGPKVLWERQLSLSSHKIAAFNFEENPGEITSKIELRENHASVNGKEYVLTGQDMEEFCVIKVSDTDAEIMEIDRCFKLRKCR
jgi:hypothetical protein